MIKACIWKHIQKTRHRNTNTCTCIQKHKTTQKHKKHKTNTLHTHTPKNTSAATNTHTHTKKLKRTHIHTHTNRATSTRQPQDDSSWTHRILPLGGNRKEQNDTRQDGKDNPFQTRALFHGILSQRLLDGTVKILSE